MADGNFDPRRYPRRVSDQALVTVEDGADIATVEDGADIVTLEDGTVVEYGEHTRPTLHLAAPLVAVAAVWVTRQSINWAYERVTGRTPPAPKDARTSWRRAIVWTVVTGTAAGLIEVTVHRLADDRTVRVIARGRESVARRRSAAPR